MKECEREKENGTMRYDLIPFAVYLKNIRGEWETEMEVMVNSVMGVRHCYRHVISCWERRGLDLGLCKAERYKGRLGLGLKGEGGYRKRTQRSARFDFEKEYIYTFLYHAFFYCRLFYTHDEQGVCRSRTSPSLPSSITIHHYSSSSMNTSKRKEPNGGQCYIVSHQIIYIQSWFAMPCHIPSCRTRAARISRGLLTYLLTYLLSRVCW